MTSYNPHEGLLGHPSGPAPRAMLRRLATNEADARYFGTPIENAASTPYVEQRQVRHEPMTGSHTHDHSAYGATDHDDGVHFHEHQHNGDAVHDHAHSHAVHAPGPAHAPGREQPEGQSRVNARFIP